MLHVNAYHILLPSIFRDILSRQEDDAAEGQCWNGMLPPFHLLGICNAARLAVPSMFPKSAFFCAREQLLPNVGFKYLIDGPI
jgi:hypothetical protein